MVLLNLRTCLYMLRKHIPQIMNVIITHSKQNRFRYILYVNCSAIKSRISERLDSRINIFATERFAVWHAYKEHSILHSPSSTKMRFVWQPLTIRVINYDDRLRTMGDNAENRKYGAMLLSTIRAIVYSLSNCGKINVLISLLESPHGVRFENVYVYSKS